MEHREVGKRQTVKLSGKATKCAPSPCSSPGPHTCWLSQREPLTLNGTPLGAVGAMWGGAGENKRKAEREGSSTLFSASFREVEEGQFGKKGWRYRRERKQYRELAAELAGGGRSLPTWVVGGIAPMTGGRRRDAPSLLGGKVDKVGVEAGEFVGMNSHV